MLLIDLRAAIILQQCCTEERLIGLCEQNGCLVLRGFVEQMSLIRLRVSLASHGDQLPDARLIQRCSTVFLCDPSYLRDSRRSIGFIISLAACTFGLAGQ